MRLEIRRRRLEVSASLRAHIERRLRSALGGFARHVGRVRVYLRDVNGPRGGVDKTCRVVVHLPGTGRTVVRGADAEVYGLVTRTADRVRRAVKRRVQRRRRVRRPRRAAGGTGARLRRSPAAWE
jgi:ribosome-associated translation inhibitor RaiA